MYKLGLGISLLLKVFGGPPAGSVVGFAWSLVRVMSSMVLDASRESVMGKMVSSPAAVATSAGASDKERRARPVNMVVCGMLERFGVCRNQERRSKRCATPLKVFCGASDQSKCRKKFEKNTVQREIF